MIKRVKTKPTTKALKGNATFDKGIGGGGIKKTKTKENDNKKQNITECNTYHLVFI